MHQYEIRYIKSVPTVFDKSTNQPIPNALIWNITFPTSSLDGPTGKQYYISGPGTGVIGVNGKTITGVPVI